MSLSDFAFTALVLLTCITLYFCAVALERGKS